jgi:hypothetical protein
MPAVWTVARTLHRRFPFRVTIEQDGRVLLAVRAQASWPGPGQQVFCIRERGFDPEEHLEVLEQAAVTHLGQVGRKLTVVLDRTNRRRCEFLVVPKTSPKDGHAYEQVFFRTESGIRAHRSRARVELLPSATTRTLSIAVDASERYPWRFPGATVLRRRLAVGDYALLEQGREVAVVERKSFDNLLADIGAIQALHHQLEDLGRLPAAAVVVEAQYGDFLDDRRLAGRWPAAHLARVLAELAALHPHLPIVYAGNRKLANAWCARYFAACGAQQASPQLDLVRETLAGYSPDPGERDTDARIRSAALALAPASFALRDLVQELRDVPAARVRRVVGQLVEEELIRRTGRGRGTRWEKASPG